MWHEEVEIAGPYDFDRVLERMSLDPLVKMNKDTRTLFLPFKGEKKQVVMIQFTGTKEKPSFRISVKDHHDQAVAFAKHILQIDKGLHPISDHFKKTNLASVFEAHAGTPLVLEPSPYSALLKSVIHQQLNMSFAATLTKRFVTTFGEEINGVWFYPEPEIVAAIEPEQLRALQFSQRKAEYVIGIGQKVASGELDFQDLEEKSDEEIIKELTAIRGIGPWTAQSVLLFGFGRMDIFPMGDIGIQNALKKHFQLQDKPAIEQMVEWQKDWSPYLSYASLYLWRSIETGK
ncbi:DNA-3-methyladenine glycosylase family protein [Jeotgalibacillus aurantiacus]|uniref:DNA-3-methyladenine glycosylase family protein n=1 Tax=Jeotgalibacillus aurantiacus TaxID=2763266 RepID=UPI001D0A1762|nr:DNA-3-methyladenine glycosylase [Jeotgalibacillus aurantiacus]